MKFNKKQILEILRVISTMQVISEKNDIRFETNSKYIPDTLEIKDIVWKELGE